tara:strand:+ start:71731 stop:72255 length:525 start_codon:yes stop_codon:yes gene_type:complete
MLIYQGFQDMNATELKKRATAISAEAGGYKNLKAAVSAYKLYLERLSMRSVPLIERHVSTGAKFKDPFFFNGDLDQRKELLKIMCNSASALKLSVSEVLWSENDYKVFFKWSIRLEKDMAGLEGVSEILFDHNYMIVAQDDYWDSASTVWAASPLMRWLFNKGKKRMFGPLMRE